MITDEEIAEAKLTTQYTMQPVHDENIRIRLAYEWLDAQNKTKNPSGYQMPTKHLVENWADRYISRGDVEVAAHLHPDIIGKYPSFNISR